MDTLPSIAPACPHCVVLSMYYLLVIYHVLRTAQRVHRQDSRHLVSRNPYGHVCVSIRINKEVHSSKKYVV